MERRDVLRSLGAALVGGVGLGLQACSTSSPPASGPETDHNQAALQEATFPSVTWRMATSWPKTLDILHATATLIAERVAEMTDDQFQITVFSAGELIGPLEVFDAVQDGTVECSHTGANFHTNKNEAFGITTGLPFGLTPQQQNAWIYHGGGLEATQKLYADFGIITFPAGNTGTQMGGWFKQEINGLDDLKGLKMRIPGLGGTVMQRLGVEPVTLASSDILDALKSGELDAAEWLGPYDDEKLGFHTVAQYYYYPGWWEPGTTLIIIINKQAWDKLPNTYQSILEAAAYEANIAMLSQYEALNQQALAQLVAGGTQLKVYSEEILEAAREAAFALYEELAEKNPSFKAMYEPWKDFRRHIYQWSRFNELSFAEFAFAHVV